MLRDRRAHVSDRSGSGRRRRSCRGRPLRRLC
jgi:hypothetical protein